MSEYATRCLYVSSQSPPFEVRDGYIQLPDAPGIGIDLDEERLAAYPYKPFPRKVAGAVLGGGAVANIDLRDG